jgi:hypothetical protein
MIIFHISAAIFALISSRILWRYSKGNPGAKDLSYASISLVGVAVCEVFSVVVKLW